MSLRYRREIDGLRALAVIPVVFFHAGFEMFKGGFVGVDVFFVISGFLITSIILGDLKAGKFSLIGFYDRRIRRILPALFLVLMVSLAAACFWMFPYELVDFAKSLLATIFFGSNIFFWQNSGYFDSASELKPLLHTWSLAVEEQYYFFLPILMIFFWKMYRQKWLIPFLAATTLISFYISQWTAINKPTSAFFLLPSRGWEILIGALVALIMEHPKWGIIFKKCSGILGTAVSALGLILIVASVVQFDQHSAWPGVNALVPTFGTALVLAASPEKNLVSKLLGSRLLVGIGLLSYSIYLWHQPILAFVRLVMGEDLSTLSKIGTLSVLPILSYFSWRFVENPFRSEKSVKAAGIITGSAATFLVIISFFLLYSRGIPSRFSDRELELAVPLSERADYVVGRAQALATKYTSGGMKDGGDVKRLLIIGDSYSQDFINVIGEANLFDKFEVVPFAIHKSCQIYARWEDAKPNILENERFQCRPELMPELLPVVKRADVIVLAFSWRSWSVEGLPKVIEAFQITPLQQLVLVGRKHFGTINIHRYLNLTNTQRLQIKNRMEPELIDINKKLASVSNRAIFLDLHEILCGANSLTCPIFSPQGELISYDGSHLTRAGAAFVGEELIKNQEFRSLLSKVIK